MTNHDRRDTILGLLLLALIIWGICWCVRHKPTPPPTIAAFVELGEVLGVPVGVFVTIDAGVEKPQVRRVVPGFLTRWGPPHTRENRPGWALTSPGPARG